MTVTFDHEPRLLARLMLLCIAAVFLFASTISMAAEYDPAQCPDAQAAVAAIYASPDVPAHNVLKSAKLLPRLQCTICCHAPCNESARAPVVPAPVALPATPRSTTMMASAPDSRSNPLLRPPRG